MCPPKRKPSYGKKSKGEVVLPMDPITAAAFPGCMELVHSYYLQRLWWIGVSMPLNYVEFVGLKYII